MQRKSIQKIFLADNQTNRLLKAYCLRNGVTQGEAIRTAIWEWLSPAMLPDELDLIQREPNQSSLQPVKNALHVTPSRIERDNQPLTEWLAELEKALG